MVWCGVVWCCVAWCGVAWHGVVWQGVVRCGMVLCGWCGVVWCAMVWYCVASWDVVLFDRAPEEERRHSTQLCEAAGHPHPLPAHQPQVLPPRPHLGGGGLNIQEFYNFEVDTHIHSENYLNKPTKILDF